MRALNDVSNDTEYEVGRPFELLCKWSDPAEREIKREGERER